MGNQCKLNFSSGFRHLTNEDEVIVINGKSGVWGKIAKEDFQAISSFVNGEITHKQFIEGNKNRNQMERITEIINVMIQEEMVYIDKENDDLKVQEVEFRVTNRCNLNCIHCIAKSGMGCKDELSTSDIKGIIDKIYDAGANRVSITGGEPLVRKDIIEVLEYARRKSDWQIIFMTNGVMIDQNIANKLYEFCDDVALSIDGVDEDTADFIRGKGVFKKVLKAVEHLKKAGFEKDKLSMTMVSTERTLGREEEFYELLERLDIEGGVRGLSLGGRAFENKELLGKYDFLSNYNTEASVEEIREELKCRIVCTAGMKKITIDEKGDMYPCLLLIYDEYKVCNILDRDIKDIMDSNKYKGILENKIISSYVDRIDKCRDCDVRYFCMSECLGDTEVNLGNEVLRDERCKVIYPFLKRVLWD